METPLLATKLFVPEAQVALVPRPRLMELLQGVLRHTLTLVSAPAGFGKTTVVTQHIAAHRPPGGVAWVSLDEGDNDPVRFWDYFVAAIRTLIPGAGGTASSMLHSPESYATEAVLTALINDLAAISTDLVVVLDDYHLVTAEPVHAGVAFLVDRMPPKMHMVIATRADPPLPLARLRGRGTILEIRNDDLRFTLEEASGLLQKMLGPALSSAEVLALNEHTEGWAVGLKMAALSLRGQRDIAAFVASFTGSQRYVMDYLVEEVLKRQPGEVRDFLLKTSVLEKLTAPLCDSLTGRKGSQDMLVSLEQSNLFVVPLDASRGWYRYHHLFAELLRHQLEGTYGAEEIRPLHRRASRWYEEHDLVDDAVHHAIAASDWEMAISLIAAVAEDRTRKGEMPTLLAWLRRVPAEVLIEHRQLYHRYAFVLEVAGQLEDAEHALRDLERTSPGDSDEAAAFVVSQGGLARRRGDHARAIELLERALSMLPSDRVAKRARAAMVLGFALLESTSDLDESFARLSEAFDLGRQVADDWVAAGAFSYMSYIMFAKGQLDACERLTSQVIETVGRESAASLYCELGLVHYERNDIAGADRTQQLAVEGSELRGNAEAGVFSYPGLAWDRMALGDVAGAEAVMEKGDRLAKHPTVSAFSFARYAAMRVMFAIRLNDMAAAEVWFERASQYSAPLPFPMVHVPARLSIARGDMSAARRQLQSAYEMAAGAGAWGIVILIRVYQSLAADSPEESLDFLAEALRLGEPRGYIRTLVDEGKLLKPLLEKALSRGITPGYTRKLLDIIDTEERGCQARDGVVAPQNPRGLLSERELEILRLVAAGLSNRQIAYRLIIGLGTAKTHVHNVFEKLDVKTRTQAISRARELKLI